MSSSVDVDSTSILIDLPFKIFELEIGFESVKELIRFLDHELIKLFVFELFEHAKLVPHLVDFAGETFKSVEHEMNHVDVNTVFLAFVALVRYSFRSLFASLIFDWHIVGFWALECQLVHNIFDCGLEPEFLDRLLVPLPFLLLPLILL